MAQPVEIRVESGVAFLVIDNPPVNALGRNVRMVLMDLLDQAEEDGDVSAIVLMGRGRTFPAGADIAEFDAPLQSPSLPDVCDRIEACEIPVVAALHGTALGGGFEIALAAHYRLALKSARIGLPEVKLGILPGAGGTQRAPRLAGAKVALDMMLSGRMYAVDRPPGQVFIDALAEGDLTHAALRYCNTLLAEGKGPRPTRARREGFQDAMAYQDEVAKRRVQMAAQPEIAPREIVSAVEVAQLLPFEGGMTFEEAAFRDCVASDQSKALRHAFFAERRAPKLALPDGVTLPEFDRVTVLGGGPLAMQIVVAALLAGMQVSWGTRDEAIRQDGLGQARAVLARMVERGMLSEPRVDALLAMLRTGESGEMARDAQVIVLAARGQGDVPSAPGVARLVARPGQVDGVGLRFALPVYIARAVELVQGKEAAPRDVAAGLSLIRRMGKVAVPVRSDGDTIAGRMVAVYQRAADSLVDLGQSPYVIDRAMRDWGWMRAPFELSDALGLADMAQRPRAEGATNWADVMVSAGRAGRAAGKGFYDWSDGRAREETAATDIVLAMRPKAAPISARRLVRAVLGAMANEGVRMINSGMAVRPSDIDVALMLAQDFPRWRGGPMAAVGFEGLFAVAQEMRKIDHPDHALWTPEPVWGNLIKNGQTFETLNG